MAKLNSVSAQQAVRALGGNVRTARLKRRISMKGFAERIGVSESTVARLEKGDVGVSLGTLAMACLVLGEIDRISDFLDDATDDTGLFLERRNLPKRIREKRRTGSTSGAAGQSHGRVEGGDDKSDKRVGF